METPNDLELSADELIRLVERVFRPTPADRRLLMITDLPDAARPDTPAWAARRSLALDWARRLDLRRADHGLAIGLALYRHVRANNAELPATAFPHALERELPADADALDPAAGEPFETLLSAADIVLAPTELSATAPLKLAAPRHGLRAATMPGFSPAMVPALRLDYAEVDRRVRALAARLDAAHTAVLDFVIDERERTTLTLDLRHRKGTASGGLVRQRGEAFNLPSGEAFIVPYEGERAGDASRSRGILPVELDGRVVRYEVTANRAIAVSGEAPAVAREAEMLAAEPAYGNLAELGLGVLTAFGVAPIGALLLDEKLGPHLAFGRSDHFGGQVGPADFHRPENVVHIDRVYLPSTQPRVLLRRLALAGGDGGQQDIWRDGAYLPEVLGPVAADAASAATSSPA